MKRYFAYIRVSTVRQGERGSSLQEQKSAIAAYADRHGLKIVQWYEEMETAAKQGRRQFSDMIKALMAGKAQGLIIHKIDRSARNLRDWANLGDIFDRGIDVRFVTDNFDLSSRGGRLSADIQAVVAADYVRNLREEVKKGMYGRLKQGIYPWAAPIGYLDQGGGKPKAIDPVKGPLVRRVFAAYGSNAVSLRNLGSEMFKHGLATAVGDPLSVASLSKILRNPFYCGIIKMRGSGLTYPGIHEPLISRELFARVQAILDGKTVPKSQTHEFLFRQMVHCEICGRRTLSGENHKGHAYYRCHSPSRCQVSWRSESLEACVLSQVRRIRIPGGHGDFGDVLRARYRERGKDRASLRRTFKLKLEQVEARIDKLTDLLIDDTIDKEAFTARKQNLLLEKRGLEERIAKLDGQTPFKKLLEGFERNNRELLRYEMMSAAEKRRMLEIIGSNFSASRENLTFTLRSPYKEIAEIEESDECGHVRDDVRTSRLDRVFKILFVHAEEDFEEKDQDRIDISNKSPMSPTSPRLPANDTEEFREAA